MGAVLDAYALLAFVAKEPGGAEVRRLLRRGETTMPSINLAEALDHLQRREGIAEDALRQLIEQLPIRVFPLTEPVAWRAANLRATYYRRRTRAVSIADCVLVASAQAGDEIVTNDPAVLEMARAERIKVVELA